VLLLILGALGAQPAAAGGGPLGIDHEWSLDQSGIWSPRLQNGLVFGAVAAELAGGIWFGDENPLGNTFWQSVDSTVISTVSAEVLKYAFSRARPNQGEGPDRWFQGSCCNSFPSGHVTVQASFVTPFIVNYAHDHPWVWALEVLPLYTSVARLKSQAHWQTDVIGGWALGTAVGYWSTKSEIPLSVRILPHGLTVGVTRSF
jgi:undecaprenyl-diphosphatase